MKMFPSLTALLWLTTAVLLPAQTIKLPPNPNDVTRRKIGEGGSTGGSAVNIAPGAAAAQTIVIQYVAVTPVRAWTNTDGKTMTARLLAFSAPKEGESGPVEVIREGKVRFLMESGKQPVDYPIGQLSQSDQIDIKAIAQMAKRGAPEKPKATPETPPAAPKTP
jgi:hypothetical protein